MTSPLNTVILGAGPTGLAAAYELSIHGKPVDVVEKSQAVGGLSRTTELLGCQFDLGPHIFIRRNERIVNFWKLIGENQMFSLHENSKQYFRGKAFGSFSEIFLSLPVTEQASIAASFLRRSLLPKPRPSSYRDQMVNDYGDKMYSVFHEGPQKKFWGVDPGHIERKWAHRMLSRPSFLAMAKRMIHAWMNQSKKAKAKADAEPTGAGHVFFHHKNGSGHLYDHLKEITEKTGIAKFHLQSEVTGIHHQHDRITAVDTQTRDGTHAVTGEHFISTLPLNDFVGMLKPKPPQDVIDAASKLYFRDLVMVNFVVDGNPFDGQWLQIISDDLQAYRITNFRNLSDAMGRGPLCPLSVEYNCFRGDDFWRKSDAQIIELAKDELEKSGLVQTQRVVGSSVLRAKNAYPVYFIGYQDHVQTVTEYLAGFKNLQSIGRSAIYRYNNMGHAVESGLLAADHLLGRKTDVGGLDVLDGTKDIYNNV
ncbi:FAD-dependent oxidoreductase [Candidatus Micrarchaeota archaeon]|nr:FAD-dependent oxidoreductase [Candidatus Micrarchaeota archaeon]